jgi:proprotein convertase subtilisin/kexin type 5
VISCPTGCRDCDTDRHNNLVCRRAASGYVLIRGNIYQCSITCLTCAQILDSSGVPSICLSCPSGYSYFFGTCNKCTGSNAVTCRSRNPSYSTSCLPGFTAVGGVCTACGDSCLKCNIAGAGSCDVGGCKFSSILKSDGCLPCFKGCYTCTADPNQCIKCSDFYYLASDQTCQPCSSNCANCLNSTVCTNC